MGSGEGQNLTSGERPQAEALLGQRVGEMESGAVLSDSFRAIGQSWLPCHLLQEAFPYLFLFPLFLFSLSSVASITS